MNNNKVLHFGLYVRLFSLEKNISTRVETFLPKKATRLRFMSMFPYENDIFVLQKRTRENLFLLFFFMSWSFGHQKSVFWMHDGMFYCMKLFAYHFYEFIAVFYCVNFHIFHGNFVGFLEISDTRENQTKQMTSLFVIFLSEKREIHWWRFLQFHVVFAGKCSLNWKLSLDSFPLSESSKYSLVSLQW